jgi:hypothetical protein
MMKTLIYDFALVRVTVRGPVRRGPHTGKSTGVGLGQDRQVGG